MHNFRELDFWKRSMALANRIHIVTKAFPDTEKFGLTSQIRRSSISIPSNIAEGASRDSSKDFNRFLQMAIGSAFELETQIILASQFDYIDTSELNEIMNELNKYKG